MKTKSWFYGLALMGVVFCSQAAPPIGDTQGTVAAVRVRPVVGGVKSFDVWFSQVRNDRWGCLGGEHIVIYENGYGVTPETYKQMFALAMLAQASGRPLALDSSGTNPCSNVNMAWVVG